MRKEKILSKFISWVVLLFLTLTLISVAIALALPTSDHQLDQEHTQESEEEQQRKEEEEQQHISAYNELSQFNPFVVNLDCEGAVELSEEQLLTAIMNHTAEDANRRQNLLAVHENGGFMWLQDSYRVSAVFAIAVALQESNAGNDWEKIPPSSFNWLSLKAFEDYTGQTCLDTFDNDTIWRSYHGFIEATIDFGDLMVTSQDYFAGGNNDVASIGISYCEEPDFWISMVESIMLELYEAAGIEF